jgi:short-subunit dehydrogenase/N-acetylglutamate synthase-like GNAT family acetyltransferase
MNLEFARASDEPQMKQLLAECGLPYEDIIPSHLQHFLVQRDDARLAGVVGLEMLGRVALLRSLAVPASYRGKGIGSQLTRKAEEYARSQGVEVLYMLTTTADAFFARRGYHLVDRNAVPTVVGETAEFQSLCPASATCRVKHLRTALITGASSGIGAVFARRLAAEGYNLFLVARREARLAALTVELQERHPITVEILVADLSNPSDVKRVERRITEFEDLDMLINNAGFGTTGRFAEVDLAKHVDMIHVHVSASVRLCRAALPDMVARRRGVIINVSSLVAFVPMPGSVTYCATKAYLNIFSEALQIELGGTGVRVQALCPGFTYTEFHDTPEYGEHARSRIPKPFWMSAEEVVAQSLSALNRSQVIFVPGFMNRLLAAMIRLTPRPLLVWASRRRSKI